MEKRKLSLISSIHYFKLVYRSLLFVWALWTWFANPVFHTMQFNEGAAHFKLLFVVIWIVFALEMCARFFPSPTESMGCQKQFGKNFVPADGPAPQKHDPDQGVWLVVVSWLALNGIFAVLHMFGLLSDGALLLIALFYSVADMICILFFCPFQTWMMKNRCCTACRIYNWDFLMMFTPLVQIRSLYTLSLVALALGLLIKWEITARRHPEYFSEEDNASLRCVNCEEKLCQHKKQLRAFWHKEYERLKKAQFKDKQ